MNSAQKCYTTTEKELLAIVETLKEFNSILLGQQLKIYTDHKNLTCKGFNTNRVMRWRLLIEEYSPELIYIKGEENTVADSLSRLEIDSNSQIAKTLSQLDSNTKLDYKSEKAMADAFAELEDDSQRFALTYKNISREQNKDKSLMKLLKNNPNYSVKIFHGGGKRRELVVHKDKIALPSSLQQHCVDWYHTYLCHPGEGRTEATIRQHFF